MNQPMKVILESHGNRYEATLPWDCDFYKLLDTFLGLCSTATFPDKHDLYESIWQKVEDDHISEEEYEKRKRECPELFGNGNN